MTTKRMRFGNYERGCNSASFAGRKFLVLVPAPQISNGTWFHWLFSTSIVLFSVFLEDMGQDNVTRAKRGSWGNSKVSSAARKKVSFQFVATRCANGTRNDPRTETQRGKPSEAASREERSQRARYVRGRNLSRSLERAPYL